MSKHGQRCGPTRARDTKDHFVVVDQEEIADSDTQLQLSASDELFDNTVHIRNDSGPGWAQCGHQLGLISSALLASR